MADCTRVILCGEFAELVKHHLLFARNMPGYLFRISALKGNYLHSRELAYHQNNYRHYLFDRRITWLAKHQLSICPDIKRINRACSSIYNMCITSTGITQASLITAVTGSCGGWAFCHLVSIPATENNNVHFHQSQGIARRYYSELPYFFVNKPGIPISLLL